jgi:hypothetical protein
VDHLGTASVSTQEGRSVKRAEAAELLGVAPDAAASEVSRQYGRIYSDYQLLLTSAPTPKLRELYQSKLRDLDAAREVLGEEPPERAAGRDLPLEEPYYGQLLTEPKPNPPRVEPPSIDRKPEPTPPQGGSVGPIRDGGSAVGSGTQGDTRELGREERPREGTAGPEHRDPAPAPRRHGERLPQATSRLLDAEVLSNLSTPSALCPVLSHARIASALNLPERAPRSTGRSVSP